MKTIREVRDGLGMTQVAFAAAVEVSPSTVHKWEARESDPSAVQLRKVARLAGVSMDEIDFEHTHRRHRRPAVDGGSSDHEG